jgi:hypothetical protein
MEQRTFKFWTVVLTGVLILGARHSTAQPFPPDVIKGAAPLGHALDENDQDIDKALQQRNQKLEQLKGRKLKESEKVKLARRVVLQPHPDSPVKDVIIIWYEFSDGSVGQHFTGPMIDVNSQGPIGWHTEAINVEEGWYVIRYATPEELEAQRRARDIPAEPAPGPAVENQPFSFLERVLEFFSPSEALAGNCTPLPTQVTHSVSHFLVDKNNIAITYAEDGVKLTWVQRDAQTCSPKIVAVPPPLCNPNLQRGWTYDTPCNSTTFTQLYGAVSASHTDAYRNPDRTVAVNITSSLWANEYYLIPSGSCVFSPSQPANLECGHFSVDNF